MNVTLFLHSYVSRDSGGQIASHTYHSAGNAARRGFGAPRSRDTQNLGYISHIEITGSFRGLF
jgi:hypothetical protein